MIIVFAGCDCAGKSTCISMFDKSQWTVKKGAANSDPMKALEELKRDLAEDKNVIHDRIPVIDDFVYSRIFSKKPSALDPYRGEISDLLKKCIVVYFDCDNAVLMARMNARGDEFITLGQIPEIKSEYESVFRLLDINPCVIDTTMKSPKEVFREVMEVINDEEH